MNPLIHLSISDKGNGRVVERRGWGRGWRSRVLLGMMVSRHHRGKGPTVTWRGSGRLMMGRLRNSPTRVGASRQSNERILPLELRDIHCYQLTINFDSLQLGLKPSIISHLSKFDKSKGLSVHIPFRSHIDIRNSPISVEFLPECFFPDLLRRSETNMEVIFLRSGL
ncbi:hypothetical protein L2E82_29969 [Cichorium intybus]|uniref:Uncharacterized protein n=1 Tax=Cichorium intybus TaxID=13427 RepID=A0ACB9CZ37_CICIN|nr:hypothetical protein L2E82_29969 [Cichorium intybus]